MSDLDDHLDQYMDSQFQKYVSDYSDASAEFTDLFQILQRYPPGIPVTIYLDYIDQPQNIQKFFKDKITNLDILDFYPDGEYDDQFTMLVKNKQMAQKVANLNGFKIGFRKIKIDFRPFDKVVDTPHKLQKQWLETDKRKGKVEIRRSQPARETEERKKDGNQQREEIKADIHYMAKQLSQESEKTQKAQKKEQAFIWVSIKEGFKFQKLKKAEVVQELKRQGVEERMLGEFKKLQNKKDVCIGIRFQIKESAGQRLLSIGKLPFEKYKP